MSLLVEGSLRRLHRPATAPLPTDPFACRCYMYARDVGRGETWLDHRGPLPTARRLRERGDLTTDQFKNRRGAISQMHWLHAERASRSCPLAILAVTSLAWARDTKRGVSPRFDYTCPFSPPQDASGEGRGVCFRSLAFPRLARGASGCISSRGTRRVGETCGRRR